MTRLKHGWNTLENYLNIHERVLRQYSKYMTVPKAYIQNRLTDYFLILRAENIILKTIRGTLVRVDIRKNVEIDPSNKKRPRARTYDYTYSASIPGGERLFRYCSLHYDVNPNVPDHHKFHHKHIFTGTQPIVEKLAEDQWPHVSKFILEVLENF